MNFKNNSVFFYLVLIVFCGFVFCNVRWCINQKIPQKPIFVLLTDFGYDFAVGSIKGVLLNKLPNATIIDLDHSIQKFDIVSAGFVLAKSYHYFPHQTIFICIIDPGVGTTREPICIKTPHYTFIGPNNGIFDEVLAQEPQRTIYQISAAYLEGKPNTFHGRDLFAPAAVDAYHNNLNHFTWFDETRLCHLERLHNQAVITYIDSFGNIKTNKSVEVLAGSKQCAIQIDGTLYQIPFVKTFQDVHIGELLCYSGSNNTLEIAVNQGSAAQKLNAHVGDRIFFE
jgi:S-adenosyl-L-methionine hydrolase (adenosine-forming)